MSEKAKTPTTRTDLLQTHDHLTKRARSIMESKNTDYGAGTDDALLNFRAYESLGIASMEVGIASRMCDKMSRIAGAVNGHQLKVADESIEDTIIDLINYGVLLYAALEEDTPAPD